MVESYARQIFSVFFTKNKKAGPARKMMWVFILFIFLVKKPPTMDRLHSLVLGFHTTCVRYINFARYSVATTTTKCHYSAAAKATVLE